MSAKDYFEDITPPGPQAPRPRVEPPAQSTVSSFEEHDAPVPERSEGAEKSIRNIQVPARPRRMTEMRENSSPPPPRNTRWAHLPRAGRSGHSRAKGDDPGSDRSHYFCGLCR